MRLLVLNYYVVSVFRVLVNGYLLKNVIANLAKLEGSVHLHVEKWLLKFVENE